MAQPETLAELLNGRRAAVDASLPAVGFVGGWLVSGESIGAGAVAAVAVAIGLSGWRLRKGDKPRAVLIGLFVVCIAALIALYTGKAENFFLLQLLSNGASALAWIISIAVRWPLLGVVVGTVLGQRTRWRRDPALLTAYSRGSWVWVAQYALRVAVFLPLYQAGYPAALVTARVVLSGPLVAACLAVSWWVIRRNLPADHPGLRHPVTGDEPVQNAAS
jgi:hypothetical protein